MATKGMKAAGTTEIDHGYRRIMGQIDYLKGAPAVDVGWFAGDNPEGGGNTSIAEYMFFNEFGTERIPERPVMQDTADKKRSELNRFVDRGFLKVVAGVATFEEVLLEVGTDFARYLAKAQRAWDEPPNDPEYAETKPGGNDPLIDTGTAVNAITWELKHT